jgi:hypothetical protein
LLDQLLRLAPLQMPAGRELLVETSGPWTMQADNSRGGGDSVSWVGYLSEVLNCRGVIASHVPASQYPYPSTQFELLGPTGEPPLRYVRTVTAGIYDEGRWTFETRGEVQPFEDLAAYGASRIRDRFDRNLLMRYLEALGIHADDPAFFRRGVLIEDLAGYKRWTMDLEQVRKERTAK